MPTVGVFAAVFDDRQHILCVKRAYADRGWTTPGGRVEPGESPLAALQREVREETGFIVSVGALIGVYAAPFKDDIVLFFRATVVDRVAWQPDDEIAAVGYFPREALPRPMNGRALRRIDDAFDGCTGVVRVFDEP